MVGTEWDGFFKTMQGALRMTPYDIEIGDFSLQTIASSLSRQGRYLGHGDFFYSVAQHCWELSFQVEEKLAFVALMHDAAEMFTGDLHSWIKNEMRRNGDSTYEFLEEHCWGLLAAKYDMPETLPSEVCEMDKRIRDMECRYLFEQKDEGIVEWLPHEAAVMWLKRACSLRPQYFERELWWCPTI